jgi:hypothetical protein
MYNLYNGSKEHNHMRPHSALENQISTPEAILILTLTSSIAIRGKLKHF